MKIAFFHNLPSGGALKMLGEISSCLKARGHSIRIYSFSTAESEFIRFDHGEAEIFPLDFSGFRKWKNYESASAHLAEKINESDTDLVWVDKCRFAGAPSVIRYLKKPFVFYAHEPLRILKYLRLAERGAGEPNSNVWVSVLIERLIRYGMQLPDYFRLKSLDKRNIETARGNILTNSRFTAAWIEKVYSLRAEVVYPGTGVWYKPDKPAFPEKNVVSVGRLVPFKGQLFLAEVLSRIEPSQRPFWNIVYDYADERYLKKLKTILSTHKIKHALHYRIHEKQLLDLYAGADWTLCAAHYEPFGLVPLESWACGTPVLAMDAGGFRETVQNGVNGFLLPHRIGDWVEVLRREVNPKKTFGALALETAKDWTWDKTADKLEVIMRGKIS